MFIRISLMVLLIRLKHNTTFEKSQKGTDGTGYARDFDCEMCMFVWMHSCAFILCLWYSTSNRFSVTTSNYSSTNERILFDPEVGKKHEEHARFSSFLPRN